MFLAKHSKDAEGNELANVEFLVMGPFISPRVPWALAQWPVVFFFVAFQALLILGLFIIRKRKREAETESERLAQLAFVVSAFQPAFSSRSSSVSPELFSN